MGQAIKAKQLAIITEDNVGMLDSVTAAIASQGINITSLCAYAMGGKATFFVVTDNNGKAKSALSSQGWQVDETDVAVVNISNKVGAVQDVAAKIKAKNVNIHYCFGTVCSCSPDATSSLIVKADDADAIIAALA